MGAGDPEALPDIVAFCPMINVVFVGALVKTGKVEPGLIVNPETVTSPLFWVAPQFAFSERVTMNERFVPVAVGVPLRYAVDPFV